MDRRDFIQKISTAIALGGHAATAIAKTEIIPPSSGDSSDIHIKDYLNKMKHFDLQHKEDILLTSTEQPIFKSVLARLRRTQRTVGHGNFYLLSFDNTLKFAKGYKRIGEFSKNEIEFIEKLFYVDGSDYGFFGKKPLTNLTDQISKSKVIKVPYTGNYLFKEESLELYKKIQKKIGSKVVLTSGIRSIMKQMILFLNKVEASNGNLSLASRSLAPPGYSFHGIGDFDVGQKGLGAYNFTDHFTKTAVYKKLLDSEFVKIRYKEGNMLGVRYEPWHVMIKHNT